MTVLALSLFLVAMIVEVFASVCEGRLGVLF